MGPAPIETVRLWVQLVASMGPDELESFEQRTFRAWDRVRPSYRKPTGGFLAIGPRYQGEPVESDPTRVLFRHHGMPEWTEIVGVELLEADAQEPKRRSRWK